MIAPLPPSNRLDRIKLYFFQELNEYYQTETLQLLFRLLLKHFFGITPIQLASEPTKRLSESEILVVQKVIRKLKKQIPWQYIVEETEFYGLILQVNSSVLIPRPETEELIELIRENYQNKTAPKQIIDLCTGSGCIALSLKKIFPDANVFGLDICPDALKVARQNSLKLGLQVEYIRQDLLNQFQLEESMVFDLVVSNPPYIMEKEKLEMDANVLDHEPHSALFVPDRDPVVFYNAIGNFMKHHLAPTGQAWLEINSKLGEETQQIIRETSGRKTLSHVDLSGKERFISAT